jgi:GT2 family glycosyltransferase
MRSAPRLSLIVCTYRRSRQVQKLLLAIRLQSQLPDETLIIDGACDDETEQVVRLLQQENEIPNLKYYRVPPAHRGLTRQRNYGVGRASGELVAFLDDDTVPESDYFAEIVACFARHPEAAGIGGFITNEIEWRRANGSKHSSLFAFKWGVWERREDYRWRLRRLLGLNSRLDPGWIPSGGHGRPIGFLPPDGSDYEVEFLMGCAFVWRRAVLERHQFSPYFEGYGLYEDMDFCVRVAREAPLYLCTRARIAHYHAPSGRPNCFHYGEMVVRNGWFVWRRRWPNPPAASNLRWWATTIVLTLCKLGDTVRGPARTQSLTEALGRMRGMVAVLSGNQGDIDSN